jgi:hypothetical protein
VDGSNQLAATGDYSALVRGPAAVLPRGGIWMIYAGEAVAYVAVVLLGKYSLAINLMYLVAMGAAVATVFVVFRRARYRAFAADQSGVWLGKSSARPLRLGWEQIRQLRISSDPHGAVLQILLNPGARPTGTGRQLASLTLMFVPFGFGRARPGLLTVLPDPPRYRVPLAQVTPEELRSALSGLAPATLPIEMRL